MLFVDRWPVTKAQPHAAKADSRYFQVAFSKFALLHCFSPVRAGKSHYVVRSRGRQAYKRVNENGGDDGARTRELCRGSSPPPKTPGDTETTERQCSCGFGAHSLLPTCGRATGSETVRHRYGWQGYDTSNDTKIARPRVVRPGNRAIAGTPFDGNFFDRFFPSRTPQVARQQSLRNSLE